MEGPAAAKDSCFYSSEINFTVAKFRFIHIHVSIKDGERQK